MSKQKKITEDDLVRFGNYLLSEQREQSIKNKENIRKVHQEDIYNFRHYTPTEKDVIECAKQQVIELGFKTKEKYIMRIFKIILWSPVITFLSMLIISMFGIIWEYNFNMVFVKTWLSLIITSFFCLCILSKIDKTK